VRAGSTAAYAAKHLHNSIAIGKTLRVERGSGARIAVGLRGSHVRFVAVVAKTQSSAAALKRLYASF
jgi:hypothetical protein